MYAYCYKLKISKKNRKFIFLKDTYIFVLQINCLLLNTENRIIALLSYSQYNHSHTWKPLKIRGLRMEVGQR